MVVNGLCYVGAWASAFKCLGAGVWESGQHHRECVCGCEQVLTCGGAATGTFLNPGHQHTTLCLKNGREMVLKDEIECLMSERADMIRESCKADRLLREALESLEEVRGVYRDAGNSNAYDLLELIGRLRDFLCIQ